MKPDLSVIIPIRGRAGSKSRLSGSFSPAARERLVRGMGEAVLDAVLDSDVASQVILVTRDPVFAQQIIGPRTGVRIVHQSSRFPGLLGAIDMGRDSAISTSTLVLFGDLPAITASDVRALAANPHRVVIAPDRHRVGSNAVLVRDDPDGEFRFQFGESSYARHIAEANRLEWSVGGVERPGTAMDLDTIDDWGELPERLRDELAAIGDTDVVDGDSGTGLFLRGVV